MIGCDQTAAPESTVFATNVSGRVKAPDRIPRHSLLSSLPLSALLSFLLFFFLSYVFDSATIRIPSAIRNSCSCTLSNSGDPARFLSPISLFPQSTLLRISRHPPIFVFVIELNVRLFLFFIFCSFFYIPSFFFSLSPVFGFGFIIFFALS